jgi:hypothetical protein
VLFAAARGLGDAPAGALGYAAAAGGAGAAGWGRARVGGDGGEARRAAETAGLILLAAAVAGAVAKVL